MAVAFKCDRCGRYRSTKPNTIREKFHDSLYFSPIYDEHDLCEDCINDFHEFLKGVPPKTLAEKLRAMLGKE